MSVYDDFVATHYVQRIPIGLMVTLMVCLHAAICIYNIWRTESGIISREHLILIVHWDMQYWCAHFGSWL